MQDRRKKAVLRGTASSVAIRSLLVHADGTTIADPSGMQFNLADLSDPAAYVGGLLPDSTKSLHHIACDVTANCNLRCPFCVNDFAESSSERMTEPVFHKLIELAPLALEQSVLISCLCEPLLHPRLLDLLELIPPSLADKFAMTTNLATKRLDRGFLERLAASPIHHLNVSVDSLCKESFESLRVNAKFDVFSRNLEIAREIFSAPDSLVELRFITVVSQTNYGEIRSIIEKTHDYYNVRFHEVRHLFEQGTPKSAWLDHNRVSNDDWDRLIDTIVHMPYLTRVTRDAKLMSCGFDEVVDPEESWAIDSFGGPEDVVCSPEDDPSSAADDQSVIVESLTTEEHVHGIRLTVAAPATAVGITILNNRVIDQNFLLIARVGGHNLLVAALSETNPATAACLNPPAPAIQCRIPANGLRTFSAFLCLRSDVALPETALDDELCINVIDQAGILCARVALPVALSR